MVTCTTTASVDHILTSVTLSAKIYSRALLTFLTINLIFIFVNEEISLNKNR